MTRRLAYLLALLLIFFSPFVTLAESFAALTVTPNGAQSFDISTGVTTLDAGGLVVDKETGLRLEADFVRYEEGAFVEATAATVEGRFGKLTAAKLYVDSVAQTIVASGGLVLEYNDLVLSGDSLKVFLTPDVVVLTGNITSAAPEFTSSELLIHLETKEALLVSPYRYVNGALTLSQTAAQQLLQLTTTDMGYTVSTTISEAVKTALSPYISP